MNMIETTINGRLFDYLVCKNDFEAMTYEHKSGSYGILKCAHCNCQYLVVDNIVLTSEELMNEEDKKILNELGGEGNE